MSDCHDGCDSSRRDFISCTLRLTGGAVVMVAGASALGSSEAPRPAGEAYDWNEHLWAYLVDTTRCIGCGSCARACKAENDVPDGFLRT